MDIGDHDHNTSGLTDGSGANAGPEELTEERSRERSQSVCGKTLLNEYGHDGLKGQIGRIERPVHAEKGECESPKGDVKWTMRGEIARLFQELRGNLELTPKECLLAFESERDLSWANVRRHLETRQMDAAFRSHRRAVFCQFMIQKVCDELVETGCWKRIEFEGKSGIQQVTMQEWSVKFARRWWWAIGLTMLLCVLFFWSICPILALDRSVAAVGVLVGVFIGYVVGCLGEKPPEPPIMLCDKKLRQELKLGRKAFRLAENAVDTIKDRVGSLKAERDRSWAEAREYLKSGQKAAAQRCLKNVRANELILDQLEKNRWVFEQLLTQLEFSKTDQELCQTLLAINAVVEIDAETRG